MVWSGMQDECYNRSIYLSVGRSVGCIYDIWRWDWDWALVWYDAVVVRAGRIGGGFLLLGCLFA